MTDKIKAIIVEDEPLARMGLVEYVENVDFLHLCQICEDALQANNAIHEHRPDLMFLDIQMPRLTGIDFLKSLSNPPMVIFTTAYPNYALQGFELDVIDYLVKPYPFDRFLKAVNKARDLFLLKSASTSKDPAQKPDHFFVKADSKLERVNFNSIAYIEAMENYVVINTDDGRIITLMTMKALEDELPGHTFIRIHKSYIVNKDRIKAIDGNEVVVGNKKLPISRQKKQEILDKITRG
jgi:DNA-binding LytR/AlgR family response regulator